MKKLRLLASFILVILMLMLVSSAAAQGSYSFSMDREIVNVYWNSDGTEAVDYVFSFTNDPSGHVIDFVDVGMPNGNYDTGSISADVNGASVNISTDYQGQGGSGFSVDMGSYAIQPGTGWQPPCLCRADHRCLYKDTSNPDTYASADFSPTWFGSQYVHGNTDLTVIFHLPPGVQSQEPRYHSTQGGWPCADQPAAGL